MWRWWPATGCVILPNGHFTARRPRTCFELKFRPQWFVLWAKWALTAYSRMGARTSLRLPRVALKPAWMPPIRVWSYRRSSSRALLRLWL